VFAAGKRASANPEGIHKVATPASNVVLPSNSDTRKFSKNAIPGANDPTEAKNATPNDPTAAAA